MPLFFELRVAFFLVSKTMK